MKNDRKTKYGNSVKYYSYSKDILRMLKLLSLITLTILFLISGKTADASSHAAANTCLKSTAALTTTNAAIDIDLNNSKEITEDQADKLAKDAFKKYFKMDIGNLSAAISNEIESPTDPGAFTWDILYSARIKSVSTSLNISIDSKTGRVCRISKYGPVVTKKFISKEAAKASALNYISQLLPEAQGNLTEVKPLKEVIFKNNVYAFSAYRLVNGIVYNSNHIQISINKYTGELVAYSSEWDENITAPSPVSIIDKAKADKMIEDNADFYPTYFIKSMDNSYDFETNSNRVIYKYDNENKDIVDAKTGELISASDGFCNKYSIDLDEKGRTELLRHTSVLKVNKELSKDEAKAVIMGYLKQINPVMGIKSLVTDETYGNKYKAWRAELIQNGTDESGFLVIDAETGTLMYFGLNDGKHDAIKESKVQTGLEEGYKKAINLLQNIYPDKLSSLTTKQEYNDTRVKVNNEIYTIPYYYYNFTRTKNGIIASGDRIHISISKETGDIKEVSCNFTDTNNADTARNMLDKESIKKIFFKNFSNDLSYISVIKKEPDGSSHKDIRLVYMNQYWNNNIDFIAIDALNGELLDSDGNVIKTNTGN